MLIKLKLANTIPVDGYAYRFHGSSVKHTELPAIARSSC